MKVKIFISTSAKMSANVPEDAPDRIGPDYSPTRTYAEHLQRIVKACTTRDGLIGDYDYGFLFKPNL